MFSTAGGVTEPRGTLTLLKTSRWPAASSVRSIVKSGFPGPGLTPEVRAWRAENYPRLWKGMWRILAAKHMGVPSHYGSLFLDVYRKDGSHVPLGLAGLRVVTTAGVNYISDAFQGTTELELMKYHGFGTGSNAEAIGNTTLHTELTTEYAVNSTRPTGSLAEGATANIFRTIGTLSPDATVAITEHGIFSADTAGTLLDKTLFTSVGLVSGDSLQATYELTLTAGS